MKEKEKKDHIILAADLKDTSSTLALLRSIRGDLAHVKIGPRLFASGGMPFIRMIMEMGFKVFLDLKLHDIPNTVSSAVEFFASSGIWSLTLHSAGGAAMLRSAVEANRASGNLIRLFGVTVLTSLDPLSWEEINPGCSLTDALVKRASLCRDSGLQGIVCSPTDLPLLVPDFGGDLEMVVPGIRDKNGGDDQRRTASPEEALAMGADFLVIGRPVLRSDSPADALADIIGRVERWSPKK